MSVLGLSIVQDEILGQLPQLDHKWLKQQHNKHSYQKLRKSMNKSHSLLLVLCWQHTWSAHSTIDTSVELDYQAASCSTPSRSIQGNNYRREYHQLGFRVRAEEKEKY